MKILLFILAAAIAACGPTGDPNEPAPNSGGSQTLIQDNMHYRAETLLLESFPVQVATNVEITNPASAPVTVTFPDGCLVMLRVYRDAERTRLAWDMARGFGCTGALVPVTVPGGESKIISAPTVSAATILGDSLPNGRYYFSAMTRPGGVPLLLRAGSADLAK